MNSFTKYTKFDFTVDEGKERLNPFRERIFLLCDPGWYVHKPDVQNKWDAKSCNVERKARNQKKNDTFFERISRQFSIMLRYKWNAQI